MLIINADDLGRTREATDNSIRCFNLGLITSASAMVFMSDSERAAESTLAARLESGLHLNLDTPIVGPNLPPRMEQYHQRIVRYLRRWKWTQVIYNPSLKKEFCYIFQAQFDEYCRLYGKEPIHIDGHHHMHLCSNMVVDHIIPRGMRVRRNFTFVYGEKELINRIYRKLIDGWLTRRYICTDAFFSIEPIQEIHRLGNIFQLARSRNVELMTHPADREQYKFLLSPKYRALIEGISMGTHRMLSQFPR